MGNGPELLTVAEVAARFRVSRQTIHNWRAAGVLEAVKVGGVVRIRAEDVEKLLDPERAA